MAGMSQNVIKAGADVNITDKGNKTALSYATDAEHPDCVKALLDAGTGVNVTDHQGKTILMTATERGDLRTIQLIKEAINGMN